MREYAPLNIWSTFSLASPMCIVMKADMIVGFG